MKSALRNPVLSMKMKLQVECMEDVLYQEEMINNPGRLACSHGARRRDGSAFLDRPTTTGPAPLALHCSSCSAHEKAAADASYDVAAAKGRWKQGTPFLI